MIESGLRLPLSPLAEKFHQTGARGAARSRHRASRPAGRGRTRLDAASWRRRGRAGRAARRLQLSTTCSSRSRLQVAPARCRPLEVPPDLTSPARDNRYAVPETGALAAPRCRATRPSGVSSRRARRARPPCCPRSSRCASSAPARSAGWWCSEPPEKLWPLVKDFWQENGFLIKIEMPEAGVMETDWAENRAKVPARHGAQLARQAPRPGATRPPSATSSARASTARPTGRAPRSTSATAAWRRSTPRASRPARRRGRPRGSRARPTRSSRPSSCAG